MEKDEFYLTYVDGDLDKMYLPFCPFPVSGATIYQSIMMMSVIYKSAIALENTLISAGHKMNEQALMAFKEELGRHYSEIIKFKLGIEN